MQKSRKKLEKNLRESLVRCLLLPEEEKKFWLGQVAVMPDSLLLNVFDAVETKNLIMDCYTKEALKKDPDHKFLAALDEKIKQIKKGALMLEERAEIIDMDADLKKKLKNI